MRLETLQGVVCLEPFKEFPQMGRFTLRDEGERLICLLYFLLLLFFFVMTVKRFLTPLLSVEFVFVGFFRKDRCNRQSAESDRLNWSDARYAELRASG